MKNKAGILNTSKKNDITKPEELMWYFSSSDHGTTDGIHNPLLEYFQGDFERYIAREVIQNSLDAVNNHAKPVKVNFEVIKVDRNKIPGINELKNKINLCLNWSKGDSDAQIVLTKSLIEISNQNLHILKISDSNTSGLTGSDSDNTGKWYRLVRSDGISGLSGAGGGSFGIGKGAPFVGSSLRTVFYSTLNSTGETIFQGKAILTSHEDNKDTKRGTGFFGKNGYESVRDLKSIPDLFVRKEQGTNIFILGYIPSVEDWKKIMIKSILDNFWPAVYFGKLELSLSDHDKQIIINKKTLEKCINSYVPSDDKTFMFYKTVAEPTFVKYGELPYLKKVILYIRKQDDYTREIQMMRKPKMVIETKKYTILRDGYAGVFICENDEGNKLLRELEPPTHDRWDKDRGAELENDYGKDIGIKLTSEINDWIKNILKELNPTISSNPEEIPGLNKFLPFEEDIDEQQENNPEGIDLSGKHADQESGVERTVENSKDKLKSKQDIQKIPITLYTQQGDQPGIKKVKNKKVKNKIINNPNSEGGSDTGQISTRINTNNLYFRYFLPQSDSVLPVSILTLRGRESCSGSIKLTASAEDTDYNLEICSAVNMKTSQKYKIKNSLIEDLRINEGETIKIKLELKNPGRYAVGLEEYAN